MNDLSLNNTCFKPLELGKVAAFSMENTQLYSSVFLSLAYQGCQIDRSIELRENILLHGRDYAFGERKNGIS